MESFVSIALLLIVKVANPPQSLPARTQPTGDSPTLGPAPRLHGGTAQQQGFAA